MSDPLGRNATLLTRAALVAIVLFLAACGGGGDSSSPPSGGGTSVTPLLKGKFVDAPVAGLNYVAASTSGVTDADGFFNYAQSGEEIQFFVGAVPIGRAQAAPIIHVFDMAATRDDLASGVNTKIAQVLQSLDTNAGQSSTIQLPANLAAKLANPTAIDLTANQAAFEASLKSALASVGTSTPVVSASVAKANAAAFVSQVDSQCLLPVPKSPDFSLAGPYAITAGNLTCLDRAKVNYFIKRINPILTLQIDSAGQQAEMAETAYSDSAAQAALDVSPVMAALAGFDAAADVVDAAKKKQTALAALSVAKILTATGREVVDLVVTFSTSDGSARADAARANQYVALAEKVIDTLGAATTCTAYFAADRQHRKDEDRSGCYKAISTSIEIVSASQEVPLFTIRANVDQAALRASLDVVANGFALMSEGVDTLSAASNSSAKLRRAVFGLTGALMKTTRDSITLAYVSKGQAVPTTGWKGLTVGILDNVATPVLAVAAECYGVAIVNSAQALRCLSTQAQEVLKSTTKLAFTLIGAVETIRANSHLYEAIVTREVLSEMLWAGQANVGSVYAKYGVAFNFDDVQLRRKSESELVKQIASKKLQLSGVASSSEWAAMFWGTWLEGSFSIDDVLVSVHQYLNMIDQNTSPDPAIPTLAMFGTIVASASTCTIPAGASECTVTLTWRTALTASTSQVTSSWPSANTTVATGNSGNATVAVPYVGRAFYLYNDAQELATSKVSAACAAGTSWSGSKCQASATTGTLASPAATCTIASGAAHCSVNLSWTTTNPVAVSSVGWDYPVANSVLANGNSGGPITVLLPRGSRLVHLYNNGVTLASLTVTASCAANAVWNGLACQAGGSSPTMVAPTLVSPIGNAIISTLTPTLQWSGGSATYWQVNIRNLTTNALTPSAPLPPTASTYAVPAGVLAAGTAYRWDVTACPDAVCNDPASYRVSANGLFSTAAAATSPDLRVSSLTVNTPSVSPGGTAQVGFNVGNGGNGNSAATVVSIRINQSTTSAIGTEVATASVAQLQPGQAFNFSSVPFTVPLGLAAGSYQVWAVVDPAGVSGQNQAARANDATVASNALVVGTGAQSAPTASFLTCGTAVSGLVATCTVSGTNLSSTNVRIATPVCPTMSSIAGGSLTQQAFTCTPTAPGTTTVTVSRTDTGATLLTQPLVVAASQLVTNFSDAFDGTSLNAQLWTPSGATPGVSGGVVAFPAFGVASTQGKAVVTGSTIVVEARFAGTGGARDTWVRLIDAATGDAIQFGDTSFVQAVRPDGLYIAGSGAFNLAQRGNGVTVNDYREYRLTLSGTSLVLERGDTAGVYSERLTATLDSSIAGRSFYVRIGTGATAYSPGSFDRIAVQSDASTVLPPTTIVITNAEGWWTGTTNNGRAATVVVLDNGTYWFLYSAVNAPNVIGGGLQGTLSASGGTFTSNDAIDASVTAPAIVNATVAGAYAPRQTLSGTISEPSTGGPAVTFSAGFNAAYDKVPTVAAIVGSYSGDAVVVGGRETATLSVYASGVVQGASASGCSFYGTVAPRSRGNVYDVSVTFAGGNCSNGTSTVTGLAFYDAAARRWQAAAVNGTRTNGFIFSGTKP